jgi:hypothetical protein
MRRKRAAAGAEGANDVGEDEGERDGDGVEGVGLGAQEKEDAHDACREAQCCHRLQAQGNGHNQVNGYDEHHVETDVAEIVGRAGALDQ